jgi:hypothetical protein
MSVLLITALAATAASIVACFCVAYVVISFRRSGQILASRIGRQPRILVLTPARNLPRRKAVALARIRLHPVRAS